MGIMIETNDDKISLSIKGELTIYTVQEYKKTIAEQFVADKEIEINMSGVDEIDTSGLQLLAAMAKQQASHGLEMHIAQVSDVVSDALETSRLMTNMKCGLQGEAS